MERKHAIFTQLENQNEAKMKLLGQLPSFKHLVVYFEIDGERFYAKQFSDSASFDRELRALEGIDRDTQDFIIPTVTAKFPSTRTVVLSEVVGGKYEEKYHNGETISNLGKALKKFHEGSLGFTDDPLDYIAKIEEFYENITSTEAPINEQDAVLALRMLDYLREKFNSKQKPSSVIHGDVNFGNLIYDPTNNKFGLVDFEKTQKGLVSTDISRGAWRLFDNNPQKVKRFIASYYDGHPSREQIDEFYTAQAFEAVGAVAYFALEGYQKGYPFFLPAMDLLKKWPRDL